MPTVYLCAVFLSPFLSPILSLSSPSQSPSPLTLFLLLPLPLLPVSVPRCVSFDDFMEHSDGRKGMGAVKAAGKYRQEGKGYVVQDGDIINFKFNAPSKGSSKK